MVHCTNTVLFDQLPKTPIGFPIGVFLCGCQSAAGISPGQATHHPLEKLTGIAIA